MGSRLYLYCGPLLVSRDPHCMPRCKTPHYGNRHSRLLISHQKGAVMTIVSNRLRTAKDTTRLAEATTHWLRHSCFSHLALATRDLAVFYQQLTETPMLVRGAQMSCLVTN